MAVALERLPIQTYPVMGLGNCKEGYAEATLTAAQMKAIRATPQTIIGAQGAGRVLEFVSAVIVKDGTAGYTESADNLVFRYTNGAGAACSGVIETTGFLDAASDQMRNAVPAADVAMVDNASIVLHNNGDGEFGGTGDPVRVKLRYRVHKHGL